MRRWLCCLALLGCDSGGDEAAGPARLDQGVVQRTCMARALELAAQCPPGSDPIVGAAATAECQGAAGELVDDDGAVRGICESSDGCVVACNFQDPCTCGIDRITAEGVFCAPCTTGCGNAICEGGESPATCPEDCGSICTPGAERCAGEHREICEVDGDWGRAECRADQACAVAPVTALSFCQTRVSPAGGTWVEPGGEAAVIEGAPLEIRFQETGVCGNCEPLRFIEDGARVLALRDGALLLVDPLSGALERTPFTVRGDFAVTEHHVATSARLPIVVDRARNTTFTADPFVDDTTELEWGGVALTADGSVLAVAMAVQGEPFVALWDTDHGEASRLVRFVDDFASSRQADALAFSANGRLLIEARGNVLLVWNVEEGRYVHLIATDVGSVTALRFSPTGAPLVLAAGTNGLELWDIEAAERIWKVVGASAGIAISPDGSTIASREDGVVLRHFADGRIERRLDGRGRVDFSPDGRRLLVGTVIYKDTF